MSRILIIGGTRFMGYQLVWRLLAAGDAVTTLNRGQHPDPFGDRIERLHADRTSPAFQEALLGREFDAAVDFAAFNADDARGAVEALSDRVGHYVFISSGSVYLVREGASIPCSEPLSESAYPGPLGAPPTSPDDLADWRYGAGKRAAEDVFREAWTERHFPATRLRLPIVNGERDPSRRLESYLWRILDGGPVLLPDGGLTITRHVYSADVAHAIADLLGRQTTFGDAFNLSQDEQPTVRQLVRMLSDLLGAPDRTQDISPSALAEVGLLSPAISPFSGPRSSRLDPSRAKNELGFRPEPLPHYLSKIVAVFLSHPPALPPEGYRGRDLELTLGR